MARPIVTLVTDFGLADWFVGVVHGVILGRAPEAQIVDLSHDIPPGDVGLAAFVLEVAAPEFPAGTVHVAVVDPGVGTGRRALCVAAAEQSFLGPDNGILECALASAGAVVREIKETRFMRLPLSRTFHARDIFAPVAAHLCLGVRPRELGPEVRDPVRLEREPPRLVGGELRGRVAYIDRFGNCITNLTSADLERAFPGAEPRTLAVRLGAVWVQGLSAAYAGTTLGALLAVMGSSGRLEVAQFGSAASSRLGVVVGDPVTVRVREGSAPPPAAAPTHWR